MHLFVTEAIELLTIFCIEKTYEKIFVFIEEGEAEKMKRVAIGCSVYFKNFVKCYLIIIAWT